MAELSPQELVDLCSVFIPALSLEHGREFALSDREAMEPADFYVHDVNSGEHIGVQHTRAMGDPIEDMALPRRGQDFVGELIEELSDRGLEGFFASIRLARVPRTRVRRIGVVSMAADFVAERLEAPLPPLKGAWRRNLLGECQPTRLSDVVVEIQVFDRQGPGFTVGHSCADIPSTPKLDGHQVFSAAVERKLATYGQGDPSLILLVQANPYPFRSFYRQRIHDLEGGRTRGFREIWAVSDFPSGQWADRVA